MLGHSSFKSPDYLVVQEWTRAKLLHPTNIKVAGPNGHHFFKLCPGLVGYNHAGNGIVHCHQNVHVLDVPYHFNFTTF